MDIAMNVVLLVAAMVAAAAGIGAVLAMKMTQRSRNARLQAHSPRGRHSQVEARDSRPGHAPGPSTRSPRPSRSTSAEGFEVKARIKALRASLHREHERPAKETSHPNFADTEVFEEGDELPTMTLPLQASVAHPPSSPTPATAPVPSPMASAQKAPAFELLRLDFGTGAGQKPPVDDLNRRGAAG